MHGQRLLPAALFLALAAPGAAQAKLSSAILPTTKDAHPLAAHHPKLRRPALGRALPPRLPGSRGGGVLVVGAAGRGSSCTRTAPCALATAWQRARSGATIELRGGTYGLLDVESRRFDPRNPVTMRSRDGETATFVGSSAQPRLNAAAFVDCEGIRISHVRFDAPYNVSDLKIDTSQHIEINHVVVRNAGVANHDTGGQGVLVVSTPGFTRPYSEDVQIWNSVISNWGVDASAPQETHGIYYGSHGAVNGVIANNVVYDGPAGFGLQLGGDASNTIVTNNTIVHMYMSTHGVGSAIVVWNDGYNLGTNNNTIVNNILSNNVAYGVEGVGSTSTGNVVRNNLTYANDDGRYLANYGPNVVFAVHEPQYTADPRFVDPGRHDFRLQARSPARRKADPAYAPPFDAAGERRPGAPALGAFG